MRLIFCADPLDRRLDGAWMIVELGDGQVAGLPEQASVSAFYRALAQRLAA